MSNMKAIEQFVFWIVGHIVFVTLTVKFLSMDMHIIIACVLSLAITSPIVVGTAWILKAIEYAKENHCSMKEGLLATEDLEWLD